MYERMQTRLESELDYAHGRRLGPVMMNFNAQLAWRNWLVTQLDSSERSHVSLPDFFQGLNMLESQNNFMWLPTGPRGKIVFSAGFRELMDTRLGKYMYST
jgi:hypothetical protein